MTLPEGVKCENFQYMRPPKAGGKRGLYDVSINIRPSSMLTNGVSSLILNLKSTTKINLKCSLNFIYCNLIQNTIPQPFIINQQRMFKFHNLFHADLFHNPFRFYIDFRGN